MKVLESYLLSWTTDMNLTFEYVFKWSVVEMQWIRRYFFPIHYETSKFLIIRSERTEIYGPNSEIWGFSITA